MEFKDVLRRLESLSSPEALEGMARYGITAKSAYGVSVPNLRAIDKEVRVNHDLAHQL